jgi:hypothetical protein
LKKLENGRKQDSRRCPDHQLADLLLTAFLLAAF